MSNYRRAYGANGTWFFTVNLANRKSHLLTKHIDTLRQCVVKVKDQYPFEINAWVVLPDHMHCIWTLPEGDCDYSTRWRLIKTGFSKFIPKNESITQSRKQKSERGIWQRRFWEHQIRDEEDYKNHIEYCYINPVKHGWVKQVSEWPYSSFHRDVKQGLFPANWASDIKKDNANYGE